MFIGDIPPGGTRRTAIRGAYLTDEAELATALVGAVGLDRDLTERISHRARELVAGVRGSRQPTGGLDAFLLEYALSTEEGMVLMCLAEALLRIPDPDTVDRLIRDKLAPADWERHLGNSESILVNTSTWGLMLTGRIVGWEGNKRYWA